MAYPPFYSSFTPPFYSFHHQPGVINFTHLCSPSPNLHYQDLNPNPAHSHHLSHLVAENFPTRNPQISFHQHPPMYNPQPTTTRSFIQQPPIPNPTDLISFNRQPPLHNSTDLRHYNCDHHYEEPIYQPELISLNNDSAPQFFPSTEKDTEAEVKSQELITGSNFPTIPDEENFPITADFTSSETEERSQKLATVEAKNHEVEPATIQQFALPSGDSNHMAPFSIKIFGDFGIAKLSSPLCMTPVILVLAKPPSTTITRPSPPRQVDTISTNRITGSRFCDYFILLTPDLVHNSCLEFQTYVSATTTPSPENTRECTEMVFATPSQHLTFVFDPGGTPTATVRHNHRAFQKTVGRTATVTAPPPQHSTFVFDPGGYGHRSLPSSQFQASAISFRQLSFYIGSIIFLQGHLQKLRLCPVWVCKFLFHLHQHSG